MSTDLIERLRIGTRIRRDGSFEYDGPRTDAIMAEAADALAAAAERERVLVEALEPFANAAADILPKQLRDVFEISVRVHVGDLRRARAALTPETLR